ncbi:MAG: DUF4097 family beta strand repeat protein [Frankiales bacterium]|nr:DUF4097 family beta strand repeat protein [Frankiales bacterium]
MTSFATEGPISAYLKVDMGSLRVSVDDAGATSVEVVPADPANEKDRRAAEATEVSFDDGRLRVVGPTIGPIIFGRRYGAIDVSVRLAAGSQVEAQTSAGCITVEGELGDCRLKTSAGDIVLQDAADADLRTGVGSIDARRIGGDAYCSTGSGSVRIDRIDGRAEVKNANGDTQIGESGGPLRVKSANGAITVERAHGDVHATSANGSLRVGSVEQGTVELSTSIGRVQVGVAPGTAALLDLGTSFGAVRSELESVSQPGPHERRVEVRARTSAGDVEVLRAVVADDGEDGS